MGEAWVGGWGGGVRVGWGGSSSNTERMASGVAPYISTQCVGGTHRCVGAHPLQGKG